MSGFDFHFSSFESSCFTEEIKQVAKDFKGNKAGADEDFQPLMKAN
jgi:hypothetical protein